MNWWQICNFPLTISSFQDDMDTGVPKEIRTSEINAFIAHERQHIELLEVCKGFFGFFLISLIFGPQFCQK